MKPIILSNHAKIQLMERGASTWTPEKAIERGIQLEYKLKRGLLRSKYGYTVNKIYIYYSGRLYVIDEKMGCYLVVTIINRHLKGVMREFKRVNKTIKPQTTILPLDSIIH